MIGFSDELRILVSRSYYSLINLRNAIMEKNMNDEENNSRRNFLRTAAAGIVAVAVPTAIMAQSNRPRPGSSQNNIKQLLLAAHTYESTGSLPGIFGQACYQFQMTADIGGTGGGFGTLSDPVFPLVNSQIQFQSGRTDLNDLFIFQGTVRNSLNPDLVGKQVIVKVKPFSDGTSDLYLTIEDTPLQGLLLPAVQKVRDRSLDVSFKSKTKSDEPTGPSLFSGGVASTRAYAA